MGTSTGEGRVERAVLGTDDPARVGAVVDAFFRDHLGSGVDAVLHYGTSVGLVVCVRLADGRDPTVRELATSLRRFIQAATAMMQQ